MIGDLKLVRASPKRVSNIMPSSTTLDGETAAKKSPSSALVGVDFKYDNIFVDVASTNVYQKVVVRLGCTGGRILSRTEPLAEPIPKKSPA